MERNVVGTAISELKVSHSYLNFLDLPEEQLPIDISRKIFHPFLKHRDQETIYEFPIGIMASWSVAAVLTLQRS